MTNRVFTTRDGVRIAYAEHGNGEPIVYVRGWLSHLDLLWERPKFRAFIESLAEHHRVIRYDVRGNGLSDRSGFRISLKALVDELEDLVDHLGIDECILWGASFGGPIAIAYAARRPEKVKRLILDGTYARGKEVLKPVQRWLLVFALRWFPEMAIFLLSNATSPNTSRHSQRTIEAGMQMVEPAIAARLYYLAFTVDVERELEAVRAPTLVVHSNHSHSIPSRLGRKLADGISEAEYVGFDTEGQNTWEGDLPGLLDAVSRFLDRTFTLSDGQTEQLDSEGETAVQTASAARSDYPTLEERGYRLIENIGKGGMAEVMLATQVALNRKVAIKIMSPELRLVPGFRDRFLREARIMAELNHTNIVSVYDVGEADEGLYIAMEYAEGGDLSRRIRAGMSHEEVLEVTGAICNALAFAHDRQYVHRDLKPENVLFAGDNRVLLSDFGIAKSLDNFATRLTNTGFVIGTPAFMAPEQFEDGPIDHRVDLYSLGILVYVMLTGRRPFEADSERSYLKQHLTQPVPRLPYPAEAFQEVVDRLLAKEPRERIASAGDVITSLGQIRG